jgi:hypothetical protein
MPIIAPRGEPAPYEVRCPRCNTSFAPETRRCVHCGGPVAAPGAQRATQRPEVRRPARVPGAQRTASGPGAQRPATGAGGLEEVADEEEIQLRLAPARSALWVATLLIAVVASLLRTCQ